MFVYLFLMFKGVSKRSQSDRRKWFYNPCSVVL